MKIGNILTESKTMKVDEYFNLCHGIGEIDKSLPTLIVGLECARKHIKGFNILNKDYPDQNIRWTFRRMERSSDYKEDVEAFKKHCFQRLGEGITYKYANILTMTPSKAKALIRYINGNDEKKIYIDRDRFAFIYSAKNKEVYGLSLSTCEYLGISKEKILQRIFSNSWNHKATSIEKIGLTSSFL